MRKTKTLAERFWPKVNRKDDDCWLWQAALNTHGYGVIGRGRAGEGNSLAHRVSYELNIQPIPDNLCVLHKCDTPPCVRPDHLVLGTKHENSIDAARKGHMAWKLNLDSVDIIHNLGERGWSFTKIGKMFNVSASAARAVYTGRSWTYR
jgi:hypothetical protein